LTFIKNEEFYFSGLIIKRLSMETKPKVNNNWDKIDKNGASLFDKIDNTYIYDLHILIIADARGKEGLFFHNYQRSFSLAVLYEKCSN
jgi:hypothetical protein